MAGRLWRIRDVVSRWISTSLDLPFYGTVRGRNRTVSESTRKRGQPCGLQRVHFGVCLFVCVCLVFEVAHTLGTCCLVVSVSRRTSGHFLYAGSLPGNGYRVFRRRRRRRGIGASDCACVRALRRPVINGGGGGAGSDQPIVIVFVDDDDGGRAAFFFSALFGRRQRRRFVDSRRVAAEKTEKAKLLCFCC